MMGRPDPHNPGRYLPAVDDPGAAAASRVLVKRMLSVFGYDEAPHGHAEVVFDNARVPAASMLLVSVAPTPPCE